MNPLRWWALIGISIIFLNAGVDLTIISTALPTIQTALNLTLEQSLWLMDIYLLFNSVLLTTMGRLSDLYGRQRFLFICILLFFIATMLCGLAHNATLLIVGRAIQGIVEAILLPCSLGIISSMFAPEERGRAVGIWSSFVGIGMIIGSGLGGFIISTLGWRWTFFIKLPILLLGFILCWWSVAESRGDQQNTKLDWPGLGLITIAIAGLIIPIIEISKWGLNSSLTLSFITGAIIAFVLFYIIEKRVKNPIIQFSLFANSTFFACALAQFVFVFFISSALFLIPLFLNSIQALPPTTMGLVMMAIPATMFIASLSTGYLINKSGAKKLILIGLLLLALSALMQSFFATTTSIVFILSAFILLGASWGIILSATATAAINTTPTQFTSTAIGVLWTIQIAGGSLGVAIIGTLFRYREQILLFKHLNESGLILSGKQLNLINSLLAEPEQLKNVLTHFTAAAADKIALIFNNAFTQAYSVSMLVLLGICLVSILLTGIIMRKNQAG
jgi:EmrB/QacA subfamily drug resistance transporter